MINGNRHSGYTIVEVMIFLAVSSVLLVSAMLLIGGQQQKAEFKTAVTDFDSKLRSVMGNVASGYYNNFGQTNCEVSGGVITFPATPSKLGQNSGCIFVGQWISIPVGSTQATFTSHAGLRRIGTPAREVQSIDEAQPTPITDTAETYDIKYGITGKMKIVSNNQPIDTLAVTPTFSSYNSFGNLSSGSTQMILYGYNAGTRYDVDNKGVTICLTDGAYQANIAVTAGSTRISQGNGDCTIW